MPATPTVTPPSAKRLWASIAPTGVFLVVNWLFGVAAGAVAASIVAVGVVGWRARHRERLGWVLPITLTYVVARGAISALTGSEDVYFGIGIAVSAVFAICVLGSAASKHPAAFYVIPLVAPYDDDVRATDRYLRTARNVTVVWAVAELSVSAWEAWHLREVGPAEFVGRRTLIGWPFMAFVVFWLVFYVRFRMDPIARRGRDVGAGTARAVGQSPSASESDQPPR